MKDAFAIIVKISFALIRFNGCKEWFYACKDCYAYIFNPIVNKPSCSKEAFVSMRQVLSDILESEASIS